MDKIFKKKYIIQDNIIKLIINDETVEKVVDFYTESPFPNYEKDDDKSSINYKGENNYLAREFKKFIGFDKSVLEVGCGTGQLSLYFAIGNNNRIFALDPTLAAINLGRDIAEFRVVLSNVLIHGTSFRKLPFAFKFWRQMPK